jgi:transcriptional regulator with AAA-type ATPase domain
MALFDAQDRRFVAALSELITCNPFQPRWVELEQEALGPDFQEHPRPFSALSEADLTEFTTPNLRRLGERVDRVAAKARQRLSAGASATENERRLYRDLTLYYLYRHRAGALDQVVEAGVVQPGRRPPPLRPAWEAFSREFDHFFGGDGLAVPSGYEPERLFAWFFQLRRAFYHIYHNISGSSEPAARLRWEVWQSIFTHDMLRWSQGLFDRMADFPTLISGPTGTGKELVARAVGLSRYVPFDPAKQRFVLNAPEDLFEADLNDSFCSLNLSALAPTLIESELFGHKKGSFSGAVGDRKGWLEECDRYAQYGTVFLDEIGELDAGIQVKLLRVLQTRRFQRLGESKNLEFRGKVIAATNRDLAAEMRAGRFREDFYYRLCADRITTPSLREQLDDAPEDLPHLVRFIALKRSVLGDGQEAAALAVEIADWIERHLGRQYPWPGNVRELEQCVRNYIIRRTYEPARTGPPALDDPRKALAAAVAEGALTASELERRYCTLVYAQAGSYQEAARRLDCNWRTLRRKIDPAFLQELRRGAAP